MPRLLRALLVLPFALLPLSAGAAIDANTHLPAVPMQGATALATTWAKGELPGSRFTDIVTRARAAAGLAVKTSLLYNDRNLYVRFQVKQRGLPITATQRTDDVGFGTDDFVGIGIDP
ncbi:MAG: hypothetical protein ACP5O6_12400, partial [Candidatus Baltobacteraceae bacterium]